jgi:hypothetical protein
MWIKNDISVKMNIYMSCPLMEEDYLEDSIFMFKRNLNQVQAGKRCIS